MEFITNEYKFKSASGLCDIYAQCAAPDDFGSVKGVVQIAHGMAEHSNRYARFAMELCKHGYAVYINDHLGHGLSVSSDDELGFFGDDGVESLVKDMKQLTDIAKAEYPDIPFFLFGHSMGSLLARVYSEKYGSAIDGAIYSGTSGSNPAAGMGTSLANYLEKTEGKLHRSEFLDSLAFGKYNKKIKNQTKFDWLSRDDKEVERYIKDPYCGFIFTVSGFKTLFSLVKDVSSTKWYKAVPKSLEILMISGENDPVGEYGKGVTSVYRDLRKSGHTNVYLKLYPEARHELLNEINKSDVMKDIVLWLDERSALKSFPKEQTESTPDAENNHSLSDEAFDKKD